MSETRDADPGPQIRAPAARAPVGAHMSGPVVVEPVDCALGTALRAMLESGLRHVVVVDSGGAFLGVVSAAAVAASRGPTLDGLAASPPAHLSPASSMHEAASLMLTYGVDAAGVLDRDGEVVGIITWSDIIEMVATGGRA